ncbi:MAG: pantoate--beta-alanine ligase [Nitrospirae bacterium]|nr:pantoate--beta-alanine ligase [Nitrospirota bacterium]
MEIIRIPRIMQDTSRGHLLRSRTIGFVPTMGALHEGHLSLIRMSREENNITAVSIYVNPTQFGPAEDFTKYPRPIEADIERLREEAVDILFLPDDTLMYPAGFSTEIEVKGLSEKMCGHFRPGHFNGVATVVAKLFAIVRPTRAYFGQKDFQQTVIIRKMAKDLNLDVEVVVCPTIREEDGLALSSRNAYLGSEERIAATVLFRCLNEAADAMRSGIRSGVTIRQTMQSQLAKEARITSIDYVSAYHPDTLEELEELRGEVLLAGAVRFAGTRLIDNMLVTV